MHTMISNIIYVKFQILLSLFISQKSRLQQADHHQRCSFRQPSQLERTVSKRLLTHTHWLLLRELTENPWMLSNSLMYESSVCSGSFLLSLFTCNRQQAPDLFADCAQEFILVIDFSFILCLADWTFTSSIVMHFYQWLLLLYFPVAPAYVLPWTKYNWD